MRLLNIILFGLATAVLAVTRCGTRPASDRLRALHAAHAAEEAISTRIAPRAMVKAIKIIVNTYVHVISTGDTADQGNLDDLTVIKQIDVLNDSFKSHGFVFRLMKTTRSNNKSWGQIEPQGQIEREMKHKLRLGSYRDLNLYYTTIKVNPAIGPILGYAYFPEKKVNAKVFTLDGTVIDPKTVPGGSENAYNLGITTVHEVGHWLGLLHTFEAKVGDKTENGCVGDGDFIYDTPAEMSASYGCNEGRDTCHGKSTSEQGPDPIHNFMDYSDDGCLSQFTPDQGRRMISMYKELRQDFKGISKGDSDDQIDPDTGPTNSH